MDSTQRTRSKRTNYRTKQNHWHEMNRKEPRELMRKIQSEELTLEVVHPDVAGIDSGNESHYVAVPPTRDSEAVRHQRFAHRPIAVAVIMLRGIVHVHRELPFIEFPS